MSERDWLLYNQFYEVLASLLPPPNLVIYLQASVPTLMRRIEQRGRDFEREIEAIYLSRLNEQYEKWVATFNLCPVLTVATDNLDFVRHPAHLDHIARRVQERLGGRELITFDPVEGEEPG